MSKELYQKIYDEEHWYGSASDGRCPGVRLIPKYKKHISSPVVDLGCGRGDNVRLLKKMGFDCIGYDQVAIDPNMLVADITKPLGFYASSIICMDVIEHIEDKDLVGLFRNFKIAETQAFSIHNGPSLYKGYDLHINKKPFDEWRVFIDNNGLDIVEEIIIHSQQTLFLTKTK